MLDHLSGTLPAASPILTGNAVERSRSSSGEKRFVFLDLCSGNEVEVSNIARAKPFVFKIATQYASAKPLGAPYRYSVNSLAAMRVLEMIEELVARSKRFARFGVGTRSPAASEAVCAFAEEIPSARRAHVFFTCVKRSRDEANASRQFFHSHSYGESRLNVAGFFDENVRPILIVCRDLSRFPPVVGTDAAIKVVAPLLHPAAREHRTKVWVGARTRVL